MNILPLMLRSILKPDGGDPLPLHQRILVEVQASFDDLDARLRHHLVKDPFRDLGFEGPSEFSLLIKGRSSLSVLWKVLLHLLNPGILLLVMEIDPVIKLAGNPTKDLAVADVGIAQPAAGQSAKMAVLGNQNHGLPHPGGLHRGSDANGRITVNDDIGMEVGSCAFRLWMTAGK